MISCVNNDKGNDNLDMPYICRDSESFLKSLLPLLSGPEPDSTCAVAGGEL